MRNLRIIDVLAPTSRLVDVLCICSTQPTRRQLREATA